MKKLYMEPELELMSLKLIYDVLGPSNDQYQEEETLNGGNSGWDDGGSGDWDEE